MLSHHVGLTYSDFEIIEKTLSKVSIETEIFCLNLTKLQKFGKLKVTFDNILLKHNFNPKMSGSQIGYIS